MPSYLYSISDFAQPLYNDQFMYAVNQTWAGHCYDVRTDAQDVYVDMDISLSEADQLILDGLVASYLPVEVPYYDTYYAKYTASTLPENGSELINWVWSSGSLDHMVNGVLTLPSGIYMIHATGIPIEIHINDNYRGDNHMTLWTGSDEVKFYTDVAGNNLELLVVQLY